MRTMKSLPLRGVPICHSACAANDRWNSSSSTFSAPKSLKLLFIYQLCILGHRWHHNMQLNPSQWLSRAAHPWRCFSHVAHPMESQESTLLNQPCNWSHKMKAVHHHQEPCYIISMKLLKYNPWSCCGEVYVSQRMESWREKERKIVDYLEQRLTFLSRYESLASVRAANLKQWRKHSYKTTCHEMRLWLNDKKNKKLQTKLGVTHGSPAAFCIAYDSRGLMERILWKGRQRII